MKKLKNFKLLIKNKDLKIMKTQISQSEFNKKVEIESAHLIYIDRMPKQFADKKAEETVAKQFEVKQ